ncbi:MAG: immunoglobulin domain-containing protein, partial [Prosthecobacter sp.]|nr:immunoglobulin domain-containing protein [Prosthecobacter sp.]
PTSQAIADTTIAPNATFTIPLAAKFSDPESEKAVRFETSKGNIDILLYPSLAPQAVANFLAYVNAGDYDGVVFHRSIPGFVIQGGAFKPVATPKSYSAVTPRTSPINEPGISNVTGTISAAKLGNNPNSATHDFFLNLEDNNTTDLNSLDHQNGGFTAFGRVVTPAEDLNQPLATVYPVLSTIAALPRGNYIDNNTTATYDATLDKRILVDGSAGGFSDWPMDVTGAAPADMDVTKNVFIDRAREIAVLNYSILTNTAPNVASATIVGGELQLRGLTAGTTTITVKATDLDSQTTQQTFTVTVTANYKGPVITKQPMSLAVVAGAKATFTVTATGTALTYQWRKADVNGDFIAIDGATTKSLVINNVQAADTGSYDVLVTNATTTLTSSAARLDFKAAPAITTSPLSRLVNVGQPLVLDVAVTGAPAPAIAWLRGTATVAGQTKTKLNIPAAKLTDGGVYTARATNPSGKVTSNPANVYVVDPATVVTTIKAGAKVILKAGVTGPGLTYQWLKNGITMGADDDRVTGTNGPVLTFKTTAYSDSADYTCQATMLDGLGDVTTGIQRLAVVVRPVIANYTADTGVVGFNYDFTVPYDTSLTNTPTKFSLAALPPGLTYDSKTGRITGRPIKAGRYFVSTIISNVVGNSNTAVGTLDILPMSQYGVGTFLGAVEPSALNGNKGGRLDLTTLDSGTYTGKLVLGADTYPIAGKLTYFPGALAPQAQIIVTRKGKTPVLLSFAVDEADGDLSGQVTDGTSVSELIGFRQFWHSNWNPSSFFAGNYNMAINLKAADVGNAAVPQGSGYATMLVTGGGSVITTVKLPDGVAVTMSSIIGPRGQLMMYQMLYKNTGSMLGTPSLATTNLNPNGQSILRVAGAFRWIKDAQTTATERSYKAGFALDMDVLGRTYRAPTAVQPPLTNTRIMELPAVSNNAKIDFSQGGLAAATINPDVTVTVPLNNVIQPPVAGTAENPAKVKASLNPASGLYTGSFELVDPPGTTKRTVTFQGLLIPTIPITPAIAAEDTADNVAIPAIPGSDPQAAGYFLLNQLGSAGPPVTTTANSPILSGKVELKPTDITITSVTPDPLSDTVNPGTAYSFTVVAAGQGTLTYQWRRDGANLSGQTGAILNIPTVTEANQGSYTVVVSNGSTSVTSTPLTLNVNDPITSIGITRSPTGSTVATGQAVTFTATPNGVGPFTYQWFKDAPNNPISGATLDHYDIASANAAEHNGSYGVTVIGPVNPAGVDSGTVSLTVIDPVSSVTASRSPNDTPIAAGQPVTFTASAAGGGTFQYQWSKGGVAIPTATSVTYTIDPVAVADTGDYSVLVTNEVTPAGVASAAVNLTITDMVLNAVATRSPNGIVAVGSTVTFSVTAQGNGLTYQWRRNGSDIPGATNSTYDLVATTDDSDITFDVLVKNDATPAGLASNGLAITVAVPISGVGISQDPSGPVQAGEGNSVTFTATVTAGSDPLYQWWKGTTAIPTATGSTYTITNIAIADGGDYHVVVSNAVSSADSATLTLSVTP